MNRAGTGGLQRPLALLLAVPGIDGALPREVLAARRVEEMLGGESALSSRVEPDLEAR